MNKKQIRRVLIFVYPITRSPDAFVHPISADCLLPNAF
jgi:hypothetical protein